MNRWPIVLGFYVSIMAAKTVNFDGSKVGELPKGWTVAMTHQGGAPKWEVLIEPTAPSKPKVLGQTSNDATGGRFPLCIYHSSHLTDGEVSVAFKPVSGKVDQGAGCCGATEIPATTTSPGQMRWRTTSCSTKLKKASAVHSPPKGRRRIRMASAGGFRREYGVRSG